MDRKLGSLEQVLMFAVLRLGDAAHGLAIRQEVAAHGGREITHGAVYTTLDRLAQRGFVASWIGEDTPEGGGRKRKFYRVEPAGAEALRDSWTTLSSLAEGMLGRLDGLAGGGGRRCSVPSGSQTARPGKSVPTLTTLTTSSELSVPELK